MMETNLFTTQRKRLEAQLPPGATVLLTSNDIFPSNTDGTLPFYQETNLWYLTGINQEETSLLLCPDHPEESFRAVLFIKEVTDLFVSWNGPRLTKADAATRSGIRTVVWESEWEAVLKKVAPVTTSFYLYSNEHPRSLNTIPTRGDRMIDTVKSWYPLHRYERLYPILALQRNVKLEGEVNAMQKACAITEAGFRRVLQFVRPGVNEKQVEAEMIHEYMQFGASWADYEPIVASGKDSCILHYRANNKTCQDGALLLIDAAAGWDYYNADCTRTIPVNGRYSQRQRAYYEAVLKVFKAMKAQVQVGRLLPDLQAVCNELLLEALVSLQLCTIKEIKQKGAPYYFSRYCRHNFSHFIGLDVHDIGYHHLPLPMGAVLTIEPGIYNDEEGIGVRIENNIALTESGTVDLMATIPIEVEEIEVLMKKE